MASDDLSLIFEKKYSFQKMNWEIPAMSDWCLEDAWNINELHIMKCELNETKGLLNDKDIRTWRQHTTFTNRAGNVLNHVKQKIKPEFLTQAWCKFYEILESYRVFFATDTSTLRSLHLCEAPGAFIAALNHYVHSHFNDDLNWHWTANTLNPYYEENPCQSLIVDDRLLLPTLGKWMFGRDNTGNIMHSTFLDDITRISDLEGLFHLVTADGSIDCQDFPEEQESTVSYLHLAETIVGMSALHISGSFVIKMFTFYECASVCLMYLINCFFGEVHVFKPATSKPGNSEVYLVCLNYLGANVEILQHLKASVFHMSMNKALFKLCDLPESFLQQLFACCAQFKNYQEATIKTNLELYCNMSKEEKNHLTAVKNSCSALYVAKYNLRTIKRLRRLCSGTQMVRSSSMSALQDSKGIRGSLNQRRQGKCRTWKEQLLAMECNVHEFASHVHLKFTDLSISTPKMVTTFNTSTNIDMSNWKVTGRPLSSVRSSKFCPILLITWWNEITKNSQLKMDAEIVAHWPFESYYYLVNRMGSWLYNYDNILFLLPTEGSKVTQQVLQSGSPSFDGTEAVACYPLSELITAEINGKQLLVNGCLHVLNIAQPGDTVVLRAMAMLTRFSVGILYLLSYFFASIRVIPSEEIGGPSYWWLMDYDRDRTYRTEIKRHLEEISFQLSSKGDSEETILEVVPMQMLCEEPYYSFVYEQNTTYLTKAILDTIQKEKCL